MGAAAALAPIVGIANGWLDYQRRQAAQQKLQEQQQRDQQIQQMEQAQTTLMQQRAAANTQQSQQDQALQQYVGEKYGPEALQRYKMVGPAKFGEFQSAQLLRQKVTSQLQAQLNQETDPTRARALNMALGEVEAGADPKDILKDVNRLYMAAPKAPPKAAALTPNEKLLGTSVGLIKGLNFVTPSGEPPADPMMTVGDALKSGYSVLNDKNADLLKQNQSAAANLRQLLLAGHAVLPSTPGLAAATTGRAGREIKTLEGYPAYADYSHAMAGIIPYMIGLSRVGRVNQTEMNLVISRLQNANSYPALQAAVDRAQDIINDERRYITKAGRLDTVGGAAGAPAPAAGWGPPMPAPPSSGAAPTPPKAAGGKSFSPTVTIPGKGMAIFTGKVDPRDGKPVYMLPGGTLVKDSHGGF